MSLLRELQQITERTYQQSSGINLEEFIIGRERFLHLNSKSAREMRQLSDVARVFLRRVGRRLYLALYFSEKLIRTLEKHDPRRGLHEQNIHPFLVFIEEVNHCVHAALKFLSGQHNIRTETFVRDLELMAKIDSYQVLKLFLAYFNASKQLENFDRLWIRHHLFERASYDYDDSRLRARYCETNQLGEKYTRFLDAMSPEERVAEIRRFRSMSYANKARYINMLP